MKTVHAMEALLAVLGGNAFVVNMWGLIECLIAKFGVISLNLWNWSSCTFTTLLLLSAFSGGGKGGRGGRPGRHFAVGGIRGAKLGILAFVLINFIHQAVEKYNETNINNK